MLLDLIINFLSIMISFQIVNLLYSVHRVVFLTRRFAEIISIWDVYIFICEAETDDVLLHPQIWLENCKKNPRRLFAMQDLARHYLPCLFCILQSARKSVMSQTYIYFSSWIACHMPLRYNYNYLISMKIWSVFIYLDWIIGQNYNKINCKVSMFPSDVPIKII
jgi:hypothetical protein